MARYPSADLGARSVEISCASGLCKKRTAEGKRMMESSAKRLNRNGWTSSSVSGPPRLRRRTPTLRPWLSGSQGRNGGEAEDEEDEEVEGISLGGVNANDAELSSDVTSSFSASSDGGEGATAEGGRGPLSGSEEGEGEEEEESDGNGDDDGEVEEEAAEATTDDDDDDQSLRRRRCC